MRMKVWRSGDTAPIVDQEIYGGTIPAIGDEISIPGIANRRFRVERRICAVHGRGLGRQDVVVPEPGWDLGTSALIPTVVVLHVD